MARDRRYSTAQWQRLRDQVIGRDGRVCSVSGCSADMRQPGMSHVDHIIEVKDGGSFWDPYNCRVVCRFHHYSKTVEKIGERVSGSAPRDPSGRPFPADGHWNDGTLGREWASPNGTGCSNPKCRRCLEEGYRDEPV